MKQVFFIIHILLLTLTAYQGVKIMYKGIEAPSLDGRIDLSDTIDPISHQTGKQNPISHGKRKETISTRNIFKVRTQESSHTPVSQLSDNLEKTELEIVLWGTVVGGTRNNSYAVIEDKKERQQSLFQVGDVVQQATIKKIMRSKIILTVNGKDQILEVDNSQNRAMRAVQRSLNQPIKKIPPKTLQDINPLSLIKQARIRPYSQNGEPVGLLIYGIKPGSVFNNLGLRNGDIVRGINGTQTLTAQDVTRIYMDMGSISDMRFVLRRQGQEKEIIYSAENNTFTEQTAPPN